ncbi:MAG: nucleotidyltransferase domain-containing protein [Patescibacteria group bacterium]
MQKIDFESKKAAIAEIARKYGLSFVVLFGSQARGKTHPQSDIDIGVAKRAASYFEEAHVPLIDLGGELSDLFRRDDLEVVNLSDASPTLMRVVVRDARLLYESAPGEFESWRLFAIRVWMDTEWLRDRARKRLKAWAA